MIQSFYYKPITTFAIRIGDSSVIIATEPKTKGMFDVFLLSFLVDALVQFFLGLNFINPV